MTRHELLERLKTIKDSQDSSIKLLIEECIRQLDEWIEIYCGECGEVFYSPECPCYNKSEHPLLKPFLRTD